MNFDEAQAKRMLSEGGIAVPKGRVTASPEEARAAASELGGPTVIKAQVPAGKRGRAGAILFADSPEDAAHAAQQLLGRDVAGHGVRRVLVEECVAIRREMYAAVLNDPASRSPLVLFSPVGGMDIEEIAAKHPDRLVRQPIDIREGIGEEAARRLLELAGLEAMLCSEAAKVLVALYRLYRELDAELLEVNPMVEDQSGRILALDGKLTVDDGALPRHLELMSWANELGGGGTELERQGRELGLLYIELDGEVGVLANGAGLTMTTMDVIAANGGRAANFLEIGGANYTQAVPALQLVLSNPRAQSLLVNFCGAFARTDVMTKGVIRAWEALRPQIPVFFSIHGTGEEEAVRLLRERMGIEPFDVMDDAVRAAIAGAIKGPARAVRR